MNKGSEHLSQGVEGELSTDLSNSLAFSARPVFVGVSLFATICRGVLSRRGVEGEDEVVLESELSVRSGKELNVSDSLDVEEVVGETGRLVGEVAKESLESFCSVLIDPFRSVREGLLKIFGELMRNLS